MANPHEHAGSEQSSLPLSFAFSKLRHHAFSRARQYSTARQSRGPLGTPTSGRHRPAGGRTTYCQPGGMSRAPGVAVRTTPLFEVRPVRRCAQRCRPEVGVPLDACPHGTVRHAGSEQVRCHCFLRAQQYATTRKIAGTAWNADLRSAPPAAGGRTTYRQLAGLPLLLYGPPHCSRSVPFAALRAAVPTRTGRRSRVALHGGVRPRLAPSVTPAANRVRCHCFLRAQQYATTRKIAGTAWNADLRSAPPAAGGRTTYCQLAGCPAPALPLLKYPLL